jgi:hypothetical protein
MSQTRLASFVESSANIVVGFTISYFANWYLLPLFGFHTMTPTQNFEIVMVFTVISLVRSFVLRRYFNNLKFGNKS